jgi:GNAT superfamily N-acetyltransferase
MKTAAEQFRIQDFDPSMLPALRSMYESFSPRGAAKGLPPVWDHALSSWLNTVTDRYINLIALPQDASQSVAGHLMMAATKEEEAELALFVHQDFRRKGLGARMLRESIQRAEKAGYRRLWAAVDIERPFVIAMLQRAGFRLLSPADEPDFEMELLIDSDGSRAV